MSEVVNVWGGERLGGERLTIIFVDPSLINLFLKFKCTTMTYNICASLHWRHSPLAKSTPQTAAVV